MVLDKKKAKQMLVTIGVQPSKVSSLLDLSKNTLSQSSKAVKSQIAKSSLRNVTERQAIMDMLNSLPYEVEHNQYFQEYRNKVKDIDRKQAMPDDLNEEWRELMFQKGKRTEETKTRLAEIRTEADRLNMSMRSPFIKK